VVVVAADAVHGNLLLPFFSGSFVAYLWIHKTVFLVLHLVVVTVEITLKQALASFDR
jgi:hypothetical protein